MHYKEEYLTIHPEAKESLLKADKNPSLVERMVSVLKKEKFNVPDDENPYAEENESIGITAKDAAILADYYGFVEQKRQAEDAAYKKKYPNPCSFFDGRKVYSE